MKTKGKGYQPSDIGIMSPITKALDAFIRVSGLERQEVNRMDLRGFKGLFINQLVYKNSEGERIFITTQQKAETT